MNKIKALCGSAFATILSLPVLAEGTASSIDLSAAEGSADAIGTALSGLITGKILTNVLLVVGAGLAIWGLFLVVKWVRKGAK